jgi:hypothetical protein
MSALPTHQISKLLHGLDDALMKGRRGASGVVAVKPPDGSPIINASLPASCLHCERLIVVGGGLFDQTVREAQFCLAQHPGQRVQLTGLPMPFRSAVFFNAMMDQSHGAEGKNDCYAHLAVLALSLYNGACEPKETRFTLALLAVQWFAAEHEWIRNDRFAEYPGTIAWFRFFNTPEKLGQHLRESYVH